MKPKPNCPFCNYPANTATGVHNFRDDCLAAAKADNAVLRSELERSRQYLEMLNNLADELADLVDLIHTEGKHGHNNSK